VSRRTQVPFGDAAVTTAANWRPIRRKSRAAAAFFCRCAEHLQRDTEFIGERRERESRAHRGRRDHVVPARVADAGQRVVLAEDGDRRALAGLDGRAKRRVDAGDTPLDLESVRVEKLREPCRRLHLLITELGMIVDLARQRFELGGEVVDGGSDQVFDSAHGESPEVSVRPRSARPTPTIHRRWLGSGSAAREQATRQVVDAVQRVKKFSQLT